MQRINNRGNSSIERAQANQQVQTGSIEQNRTNPQSAAVPTNIPSATARPPLPPTAADISTIESKSDDQAQTDSYNIAAEAQDATLRQQLIPEGATAAAGGVEESKGDDQAQRKIFDRLHQDVFNYMLEFLDIRHIAALSQTSRKLRNDVQKADEVAEKQLPSLRKAVNELIENYNKDPEISGVKIPEGPFKNSIHELRELTAFKDNLPNAIDVLQGNGITDINKIVEFGETRLYWAIRNGHTDIAHALINAGADVNLVNNIGWTPLHWAERNGYNEIAEILRTAQNTQSAAAAAGGVEESKGDDQQIIPVGPAHLPRETIELDDVILDETSDSINQPDCCPRSTCTIM